MSRLDYPLLRALTMERHHDQSYTIGGIKQRDVIG
jgi:hypothetical protein